MFIEKVNTLVLDIKKISHAKMIFNVFYSFLLGHITDIIHCVMLLLDTSTLIQVQLILVMLNMTTSQAYSPLWSAMRQKLTQALVSV